MFVYTQDCVEQETHPLARGRRTLACGVRFELRNTQTVVGNTQGVMGYVGFSLKHPHWHGEDSVTTKTLPVVWETPPLAWRRLRVSSTVAPDLRNTHRSGEEKNDDGLKREIEDTPLLKWGHSHSCGEDQPHAIAAGNALETTPLAWGRLFFLMHYSDIL